MQKISIIIPVYKVEPFLRQCLDSVINQTYKDLEIILIDDGSPDHCGAICDEYAERDPRVTVIHKENAGVGKARNDGMQIATGYWITFADPDDWLELDYYEKMISAISDRQMDVFFAGGAAWEFQEKTIIRHSVKKAFYIKKETHIELWEGTMAKVLCGNVSNDIFDIGIPLGYCWEKLYKAELLKKNDIRFDSFLHPHEDELFNLMAMDCANAIGGVSYIGYHYRQDNAFAVTKRFLPNCKEIELYFLERLFEFKFQSPINASLLEDTKSECVLRSFKKCLIRYYFMPNLKFSVRENLEGLRELKGNAHVQYAIRRKGQRFLSKSLILLKIALRIPGMWPVWLYHILYKIRSLRKKGDF